MLGEFRFSEMESRVHGMMDALVKAHQLGTLNAQDRSKQYSDPSPAEILRATNEAHSKIRQLQASSDQKDQAITKLRSQVTRYKLLNSALVSIITVLAWEGVKALVPYAVAVLSR